jgi:lipid II:glycine glycyltransferase (peptidoglycan interpeptide bridge formation enzyme)
LSGIDPVKNKGVYDFKHGTGATEIKYVGEWDNGTPFYVQPLVGRLIRYRKNL